jgi:4-hydroxy-tetrahydrodipicolinate reductase
MEKDVVNLLIVGHGRMGRRIEEVAAQAGFAVIGCLDEESNHCGEGLAPGRWPGVHVAIDVTAGDAVAGNVRALAASGINVVIGTTGWSAHEADVRSATAGAGIGVVAAPTFALGAVVLEELAWRASKMLAPYGDVGAWIHEAHHAAKRDAPSGTALRIRSAMARAGWPSDIDTSSTRAGAIPGTHTVGFDGPHESLTLTHTARDRAVFAHGALVAARWLVGRRGWFTMRDVLGIEERS